MPRLIPFIRPSLGVLALAALGCGDDTAGTSDASNGGSSSTNTTADPSTGPEPTTAPTTSASGATEAMTSTTGGGTTESVDPDTGTASTSSSSTDPGTSTGEPGTTTGETTSAEGSSTGPACVDGIVCDDLVANICKDGVESVEVCPRLCLDGVGCVDCGLVGPEVCDGLDNNCDGLADEGGVCGAGSCSSPMGPCAEQPIPVEQPLVSGCAQPFPPAEGLPCPVPEVGEQFHVSAAAGNDANDGKTPATAWKTLCHAVATAPDGSTIRVAEGKYAPASVYLGRPLVVKGGFDATFTDWDPDAHPTTFYGRLTLDHNGAVFGGFRMISNPLLADAWSYAHHFVGAGTLVRNYIEIVATAGQDPDILNFYGIVPSACPDGVSVLRCNDIYIKSTAPQTFVVSGVEYGNHALHAGQGVLDANRVCQDGGGGATTTVGGYGACFPGAVSLLMRNNVLEKTGFGGGAAIEFYSCGDDDMLLTLTNNTILSSGTGVAGYGDPGAFLRWKLTNNIVFSTGFGANAVELGAPNVEILTSENNLTFGFGDNAILPPPLMTAGDDTSGAATPASVFVDAGNGDLHLKPAGQGADTGLNVFGLADYGFVAFDLEQALRPPNGAWDRGALKK